MVFNFNLEGNLKRVLKRSAACVLSASMLATGLYFDSFMSNASPLTKAQDNLEDTNERIAALEKKKASIVSEKNELDSSLVELIANINVLEEELSNKKEEIKSAAKELRNARLELKEQESAIKARIKYTYENSKDSDIESVLESGSTADVVNKADYASDVYGYDEGLKASYQEKVDKAKKLEESLKEEKSQLSTMKTEYKAQKENLENIISKKEKKIKDFGRKLEDAKKKASEYQAVIDEQNKIIKEQSAADSNSEISFGSDDISYRSKNASSRSTLSGSVSKSNPGSNKVKNNTKISGEAVASYALQFVGNPYVWGGVSLTHGADCSGFVMSVYEHFGVSLPHYSEDQARCGVGVSYANALPGDIICYGGHVALYLGNGKIVHASDPSTGIIVSDNAAYRSIMTIRRVI